MMNLMDWILIVVVVISLWASEQSNHRYKKRYESVKESIRSESKTEINKES